MSIEDVDMTGRPPSARDIDDAIAAVTELMQPKLIMKVPPQLAVNAANIRRCLIHLKSLLGGANG